MRVELTNHSGYLNIMKAYEILMLLRLHGFGNGEWRCHMESCILIFCNTGSSVSVRQGLRGESHVDTGQQNSGLPILPVKIQFISTVNNFKAATSISKYFNLCIEN